MDRVIGLIAANYASRDMGELTSERTVASLPYGSRYRLIDFPLSNMVNAGIKTVGVVMPYKYRSIIDHIGAGKEWSLDRKNGGLHLLPGTVYGISSSDSRFLLRDIDRNRVFLDRSPAPYVLITAANTVCNMDYADLVEKHLQSGADITLACRRAAADDKYLTGLRVQNGRVLGTTRGVRAGDTAFLDCFLISRSLLLNIMEWYKAINYLDLFDVLREDYDKMQVGVYEFGGYAAPIFDAETYYRRSMDLLDTAVGDELFFKERPIMTKIQDTVPTEYVRGAQVRNALIPAGCVIAGTVEGSLLFQKVRVEEGAVVRNSIIMQSCVIGRGAWVENAIIDRGNVISPGTVLKGSPESVFIKEKNFA